MDEFDKRRFWINMGLMGALVVIVLVSFFTRSDIPITAKGNCSSGCGDGSVCLKSSIGGADLCVEDYFYNDYWSIPNMYNYRTCKLTIVGEHDFEKDSFVNFFAMTLKECDDLRWSCENPSNYNADCAWSESEGTCVCFTKSFNTTAPIIEQIYAKRVAEAGVVDETR